MGSWKCQRCGNGGCPCQAQKASDNTQGCSKCNPGYENQLKLKKQQTQVPHRANDEAGAGVIINRITLTR